MTFDRYGPTLAGFELSNQESSGMYAWVGLEGPHARDDEKSTKSTGVACQKMGLSLRHMHESMTEMLLWLVAEG